MAGTATYDFKTALNNLNSKFGNECVSAVLAAIAAGGDGRYSSGNKAWAAEYDASMIADVQRNIRYSTVNTHHAILDGLVSRARGDSAAHDKKPDMSAKINNG